MSIDRRRKEEALRELYAQVPEIPGCTGECWRSCGPIELSDHERRRLRARGYEIGDARKLVVEGFEAGVEPHYCPALGPDGKCSVYEDRPMICRIWGAVEDMPCPFGCVPEGGWLSAEEGFRLVTETVAIGGGSQAGIDVRPADVEDVMDAWRVNRSDLRTLYESNQLRGRMGVDNRIRMTREGLPPQVTSRKRRGKKEE